ncbi:hypothetical protein [Dyadobacter sp. 32]|uniref:hypothetical protein n=1 Tax=Dyadobacter sp. 32 TaxID=538966 RepID=UPI0011EDD987
MKKVLLCLGLLCAIVFYACKKEVAPEVPLEIIYSDADLQKSFNDFGFTAKLTQVINDTSSIFWAPSWSEAKKKNTNDSTQFVYIPLYPQVKNATTNKLINGTVLGVAKYIIVKISKTTSFFLAQYASQTDKPVSLEDFTGNVSLRNLATDVISFSSFTNGKQNARVSSENSNLKTNACVTTYTCNWYNWNCGAVYITLTIGQNFCPYPAFSPCGGASWELSDSETETSCTDTGIIIPMPVSTFNANYVERGPDKPINNLSARLNCFTQPKIAGHRYSYTVTLYADEAVNGTNQLFDITNSYRKVGHSYFSLEMNDITAGSSKRMVIGYYVQSELRAVTGIDSPSAWGDDGNTPYDVSIQTNIGEDTFMLLVQTLKNKGNPTYNLVTNNCTSLIYDVFGGIFSRYNGGLPDANQAIGPLGTGKTPSQFGYNLRKQWGSDNRMFKRSNGSKSPMTTNCN